MGKKLQMRVRHDTIAGSSQTTFVVFCGMHRRGAWVEFAAAVERLSAVMQTTEP